MLDIISIFLELSLCTEWIMWHQQFKLQICYFKVCIKNRFTYKISYKASSVLFENNNKCNVVRLNPFMFKSFAKFEINIFLLEYVLSTEYSLEYFVHLK